MLLRSSSLPLLNSSLQAAAATDTSSPATAYADMAPRIPRHRRGAHHHPPSIAASSSPAIPPSTRNALTRARSEGHLPDLEDREQKKLPSSPISGSLDRILSSSGLVEGLSPDEGKSRAQVGALVVGGGGGNPGGGSDGAGFCFSDSSSGGLDAYYLKLIEADPKNSLVLGNYAKFLKEVHGDLIKAEEYCERAILSNPEDADVLSMYADLIWQTNKDSQRAETYFDQAVQAAPQDCYVMASYARFLWDSEEEEEVKNGVKEIKPSLASISIAAAL